jgi:hypothetical protein
MKYFLLILSSLASAATSTSPPLTACEMGTLNGRDAVQALYKGNCDNAWNLATQAKTMKTRKFPTSQGSPSKRVENRCACNAVDKEVAKIEKQCFSTSPDQCQDVGDMAAQVIVSDYGCSPPYSSPYGAKNYKKTCRSVAYGICTGQISTYTTKWCMKNQKPNTSKLLQLQNKCKATVDSLTSGTNDDVSSNLRGTVTVSKNRLSLRHLSPLKLN